MNGITLLTLAAIVGVDFGWQPHDEGGYEYIIQIPPEMLDTLRSGEDITSQLPPFLRDVRSYRITVGNEPLPRLGNPAEALDPPGNFSPAPRAPVNPREETVRTDTSAPPLVGPGAGLVGAAPIVEESTSGILAEQGILPDVSNGLPEGVHPLRRTFGSGDEPSSPNPAIVGEQNTIPEMDREPETTPPSLAQEPTGEQQEVGYQQATESTGATPSPGRYSNPPWANTGEPGADTPPAATSRPAEGEPMLPADGDGEDSGANEGAIVAGEPIGWAKWSAALLVLSASLAANLYLGWITFDLRNKYRDAIRQLRRLRSAEKPATV